MVVHPTLLHEIIKWVGIATSLGTAGAGIFRYGKKAVDWWMAPRRTLLAFSTNHFPHIQDTLKQHTDAMERMQSDLRDLDTKVSGYGQRLDDTKKAVDSLHDAFIQHLENNAHASGI